MLIILSVYKFKCYQLLFQAWFVCVMIQTDTVLKTRPVSQMVPVSPPSSSLREGRTTYMGMWIPVYVRILGYPGVIPLATSTPGTIS